MMNEIEIKTDTRRAIVPVTVFVKARRQTVRTLAGQAVLSMLHSWGTAGAGTAFVHMKVAAGDSLLYAARCSDSLPVVRS